MNLFSQIFEVKKEISAETLAEVLPKSTNKLTDNSKLEKYLINSFIKHYRDSISYSDEELKKYRMVLSQVYGFSHPLFHNYPSIEYEVSGDDIIAKIPLCLYIGETRYDYSNYIVIEFLLKTIITKNQQKLFIDLLQDKIESKDRRSSDFKINLDIEKAGNKFMNTILLQTAINKEDISDVKIDDSNTSTTQVIESFSITALQKALNIND